MKYLSKNKNHLLTFLFIAIISIIPYYEFTKKTHSIENNISKNYTPNAEQYLKYIKNDIIVDDIIGSLNKAYENISIDIYDINNQLKKSTNKIASGDKFQIKHNGNLKKTYTLSVSGDSNGDGELTTQDLVQMRKHIIGWIDDESGEVFQKTGAYYHSLDLTQDGKITTQDLVRLRKIIVGISAEDNAKDIVLDNIITINEATFNKNGAENISDEKIECLSFDKESCEITMPTITSNGTVIGWSTNKDATVPDIKVGEKLQLNNDITYYAITKKNYTATFDDKNLDYIEHKKISCDAYNGETSCKINLPRFNKKGQFNSYWSTNEQVTQDLSNIKWDWEFFKQVGHEYELTQNITMYPNFNHFHYNLDNSNAYKYRDISINQTNQIGNVIFEFEEGIPASAIQDFISKMETSYKAIPELFTPGKVFVMTKETYTTYSKAYGLTHWMNAPYGGDSYFTIDLQYDNTTKEIGINAAIHELSHAWDSYYSYKTLGNKMSQTADFDALYNLIYNKLYVYDNDTVISKTETFAAMFTNYYWHILKFDDTKSYYALKSGEQMNESELLELKKLMEKYINFAKNNYK